MMSNSEEDRMDPKSDTDTELGDKAADGTSASPETGSSPGEDDGQPQADRVPTKKRSTLETAILMTTLCVSSAM